MARFSACCFKGLELPHDERPCSAQHAHDACCRLRTEA
jgi:hypothetical protein